MPIVHAIAKYGAHNFSVHLLEELSPLLNQQQIDAKEVEWGLKLNSLSPIGYNLRLGNARGILSEETKSKISKSNVGKKASQQTRARLSESHKGNKLKSLTKKKLSEHFKGKKLHENTLRALQEKKPKHYTLISPSGVTTHIFNMAEFARRNALTKSKLCLLHQGRIRSHKGWTALPL